MLLFSLNFSAVECGEKDWMVFLMPIVGVVNYLLQEHPKADLSFAAAGNISSLIIVVAFLLILARLRLTVQENFHVVVLYILDLIHFVFKQKITIYFIQHFWLAAVDQMCDGCTNVFERSGIERISPMYCSVFLDLIIAILCLANAICITKAYNFFKAAPPEEPEPAVEGDGTPTTTTGNEQPKGSKEAAPAK